MTLYAPVRPSLHCVKPATKVVFPGIEFGSTKANSRFSLINEPEMCAHTFVEVRCHPFVIPTDEGVILWDILFVSALDLIENSDIV